MSRKVDQFDFFDVGRNRGAVVVFFLFSVEVLALDQILKIRVADL